MINKQNVGEFFKYLSFKFNIPPLTSEQLDVYTSSNDQDIDALLANHFQMLGYSASDLEHFKQMLSNRTFPLQPENQSVKAPIEHRTTAPVSHTKESGIGKYILLGIVMLLISSTLVYVFYPPKTTIVTSTEDLPFIGKKYLSDFAYNSSYTIEIKADRTCIISHEMRAGISEVYNGAYSSTIKTSMGEVILFTKDYIYICDSDGNVRKNCMMYATDYECDCKYSVQTSELVCNTQSSSYYSYPEASSRILSFEELRRYTKWELRIMRNEIFAKYGYIFQSDDLREYFGRQAWYKPQYTNVTHRLTAVEQENVKRIKQLE